MSKVLARRLKLPCYVSSSISLANSVGGGTVEEEVEAFHAIVNAVMSQVQQQ
jgi:hypothetical protein